MAIDKHCTVIVLNIHLIRLQTCILSGQYLIPNINLICSKLNFDYFIFLEDVSSEAGGSVSPVNKRRVFSG